MLLGTAGSASAVPFTATGLDIGVGRKSALLAGTYFCSMLVPKKMTLYLLSNVLGKYTQCFGSGSVNLIFDPDPDADPDPGRKIGLKEKNLI